MKIVQRLLAGLFAPIRKNGAFFVFMYILGLVCFYAVIKYNVRGFKVYGHCPAELFVDVYLLCVILTLVPEKIRKWVRRIFYVIAYTLAIIISDLLRSELPSWDIKITANDLSTQVLQAARAGLYNEYSLRTTPRELVNKYFVKEGNLYKVRDELKRMINFSQINLSNREQLKLVERSHIVFCRNVIIYFDDDMKRKVINSFYDNLMPGGALLIGHSETLHNICRSFELEHHPGAIVYRKKA